LRPDDFVYQQGHGQWAPARTVPGLFGAAAPAGSRRAAPVAPAVAAPPAVTAAPVATTGGPGLGQRLLTLPKPVLFGLCGALGGLIAALVLGEALWAALRPASVREPARVQLAVPTSLRIYAGGKNHFAVKVGRQHYRGPVHVEVEKAPPGVSASAVTIVPGQDEAEVVVQAEATAPAGSHRLMLRARGDGKDVEDDDAVLLLSVEAPPPSLRLAVSPQVSLPQGGKGRF